MGKKEKKPVVKPVKNKYNNSRLIFTYEPIFSIMRLDYVCPVEFVNEEIAQFCTKWNPSWGIVNPEYNYREVMKYLQKRMEVYIARGRKVGEND